MSNFKPEVRVITAETVREYNNSNRSKSAFISIQYPTYKELKKNLLKHLKENIEPTIFVNRSRRGNWGEWFENWQLVGGKPKIINSGWM